MKLYTRTGDDGSTGLFDGSRVMKNDIRVAAYGDVDELNAQLGAAISLTTQMQAMGPIAEVVQRILQVQSELFSIGAELATPLDAKNRHKVPEVGEGHNSRLEKWIDDACANVPPLRSFILPGGDPFAAALHVCRTVCRRAERTVITLAETQKINAQVIIYLNRLSDLLFAWARQANHAAGVTETPWVPSKS